MLIVFFFGLFIGFAGLVKGADFFVEGSIGIAKYVVLITPIETLPYPVPLLR